MFSKVKTVIIPAAGLGTRFLPATKAIPKELVPIIDRPAIQYIVEECARAGIEKVVFVISKGKESVYRHFKKSPALDRALSKKNRSHFLDSVNNLSKKLKYSFVYQNRPLGLGHAILKAQKAVKNKPFAVILPDDIIVSVTPAIKQLMEISEDRNAPTVAIQRVPKEKVSSYGVIDGPMVDERVYKIQKIVEKPPVDKAPSDLTIVGRYVLPPNTFEILKKVKPAKDGEIQLTTALEVIMNEREFVGVEFFGDRYDIGDKSGFVKANVSFALRDETLKNIVVESVKECR